MPKMPSIETRFKAETRSNNNARKGSPDVRESGIRDPANFSYWNPESMETRIQNPQ